MKLISWLNSVSSVAFKQMRNICLETQTVVHTALLDDGERQIFFYFFFQLVVNSYPENKALNPGEMLDQTENWILSVRPFFMFV